MINVLIYEILQNIINYFAHFAGIYIIIIYVVLFNIKIRNLGLLSDSRLYRERLIGRNLYSPENVYDLKESTIFGQIDFNTANLINVSSFDSIANLLNGSPLSRIAIQELKRYFIIRVAQETIDEIIPITKDGKLYKRDDLGVTKQNGIIEFAERVSGAKFNDTPFDDKDRYFFGKSSVNDKLLQFTKKFQIDQIEKQLSQNYYSGSAKLSMTNKYENRNLISFAYMNRRLSLAGTYYSDYIYKAKDLDDLKNFRNGIADISKVSQVGIGSVLHNGKTEDKLAEIGEFGTVSSAKFNMDCQTGAGYQMEDTYELNKAILSTDNQIVWGRDDVNTIEQKFKAKRGLLNFTAQIVSQYRDNKIDMRKKCFKSDDGKINYKATPCRSWTYEDYYGKNLNTLIRSSGNGKENSVLRDSVFAKIHPTTKNGVIDNTNMMFSFENLAYTKTDLIRYNIPECEWGENYGRKLWFPPYIKSLTETISSNPNRHDIIGRSEPILTYSNTVRKASMTFMLIMDYPFAADNLAVEDLSRFFPCGDGGQIDLTDPIFGSNTINNGDGDNGIGTPPSGDTKIDLLVDDSVKPDGYDDYLLDFDYLNYYFDNDLYGIVNNYEYKIDSDDPKNLALLNGLFFGISLYDATTGNFLSNIDLKNLPQPSMDDFDDEPTNLGSSIKELFIEKDGNSTPIRYYHDLIIEGNASELFIGNQTTPREYNIYLSFRRCFSMLDFLVNRYSSKPKFLLNLKDTSGSFLRNNNIAQKFPLSDFDPNKLFPNVPEFASKSTYTFELADVLVFDEYLNGKDTGLKIKIFGEGSSNSDTGIQEVNFDQVDIKRERNVKITINKDKSRFTKFSDSSNTDLFGVEFDNDTKNGGLKGNTGKNTQSSSTTPDFTINSTLDDSTNCSERFKESDPEYLKGRAALYDLIANKFNFSKIKTFAPAFHSQTPEDYHRRLTFLNQMMYSGSAEGRNNVKNSVFGRSPFAVFRLGDFFHSKIYVESISIDYSNDLIWDKNPEGMGVQPMIATVNMDFYILGGQSLAGALDRIQNSFSFNHYANSTFYDTGIYAIAKDAEKTQVAINKKRKEKIDG